MLLGGLVSFYADSTRFEDRGLFNVDLSSMPLVPHRAGAAKISCNGKPVYNQEWHARFHGRE